MLRFGLPGHALLRRPSLARPSAEAWCGSPRAAGKPSRSRSRMARMEAGRARSGRQVTLDWRQEGRRPVRPSAFSFLLGPGRYASRCAGARCLVLVCDPDPVSVPGPDPPRPAAGRAPRGPPSLSGNAGGHYEPVPGTATSGPLGPNLSLPAPAPPSANRRWPARAAVPVAESPEGPGVNENRAVPPGDEAS